MGTNHGGKRTGAGAKKKVPYIRHQINFDKALFDSLKSKLSTKELNNKLRLFLVELNENLSET